MKITICASSSFKKEMLKYQNKLNQLGHEAIVHPIYKELVEGRANNLLERIDREHGAVKKQYDFIRWYFNSIKESDAILVINFTKKNIENYIGANTFLEIGYAHGMNKKIYLINEKPNHDYIKNELDGMDIIILNNDLSEIK